MFQRAWSKVLKFVNSEPPYYYGYPRKLIQNNTHYHDSDYWPQFYHNFYVYQYSTGISAAVSIVNKIMEESEDAAEQYLDALRLGGSEYPVDVLKAAGVDVTKEDYIEDAISEYQEAITEMEDLIL